MSQRRTYFLGAFTIGTLLFGAATLRLFRYPSTQDPEHSDAVVMLAGGGARVDRAVELGVNQGLADTVVFASSWADDLGVWSARPCNVSGQERMGDTKAICFQPEPQNTKGEVHEIVRMARENGWTSLVVVASTDQITRARMIFDRCWDGETHFVGVTHNQPFVWRAAYEWGALTKALTIDRGC